MLKSRAFSNATEQRNITRLRVLDKIRATGAISRIDIASALETSPATITTATSDLLSAGLIQEIDGEAPSKSMRRGRPRILLKLDDGCHLIAGIKVARHQISVLLVDFEGTEITSYTHPLKEAQVAPDAFVQNIRAALDQTCATVNRTLTDVSGVCIGIAGLINAKENFVHWSSSLTERNVDLSPLLSDALPCPAFIENDANLVAKAEQLFGLGRGLKNFLVVAIEHGIGLGIVLEGKLYRGERGCGAEFGHLKVHLDGALCQCGQRGCLEAYVGEYALIREATIASQATDPHTLADIQAAAKAGDARSISVFARAGQMFGMGLSNLINLFDPECIILSGARGRFEYLLSDAVMTRIRDGVVSVDALLPDIKVNHWGDSMWAKGAAAYGIEQVSILKVRELATDGT